MILVALAVVFLVVSFYYGSAFYFVTPDQRVLFDVPKGASADTVAQQLADDHLIKNSLIFNFYLKKEGLESRLKAGRYVIPARTDLKGIVALLVGGKSQEISVTFPEGSTAEEMASVLEKQGLTTREAFLECVRTCSFDFDFLPKGSLEGVLFPDTYFVNPNDYDDRVFIGRMIGTLKGRLNDEDWRTLRSGPHSFDEIIKMASLVEAEESSDNNRSVVAGILWKRYDHSVGLGVDATIRYVLKKRAGALTQTDLSIDSAYNTRKYRGLPPTAIGNPGLSSIKAALYPEASDYWYYLHDTKGLIHYAKTLEEHNENKRKYL